jgi:hypothetical protein
MAQHIQLHTLLRIPKGSSAVVAISIQRHLLYTLSLNIRGHTRLARTRLQALRCASTRNQTARRVGWAASFNMPSLATTPYCTQIISSINNTLAVHVPTHSVLDNLDTVGSTRHDIRHQAEAVDNGRGWLQLVHEAVLSNTSSVDLARL